MLDTLSRDQRALLRAQLDEADLLEEGQQQATQEAVEGDFGQTYTPQREYVDQAADLVNQIEQTTGQPTGIDPYAGQGDTATPTYSGREPQSKGSALDFLSDPYGTVSNVIQPNQSVPPRPQTPMTRSVMETIAPTPKQVVKPLEQRGAPTKKVPPPQIPQMVGQQKTGSVSAKTVRPITTKGPSQEAAPLEQRNIEDIRKRLKMMESEEAGMPYRFDLGVEAKKSQLGIEEEIAGREALRQADLALSEQQRAETIEKNAMQRIEAGEKIINERLPVDPNRWFNSRSTLQKIAFGIALGFDQTGKNTSLLMNLINQDINAQEKEYEEKGKSAQNLFSVAKEMYGSSDKAREATRKAFGDYSKALSEAQKAGLNINSPQVQWQVAQDLTKTMTDNMKITKDYIGLQIDAQKAGQERRYNEQKIDVDRQRLAQDWARIELDAARAKVPDEMDRRVLQPLLTQARNANNMERLESSGFNPQSPGFVAFAKAKEYGLPVGKAVPREYSEYYNSAFDFLFNKLKVDTGAAFPDAEYRRRAALAIASMADSPNFAQTLSGERARYINEQTAGLSQAGKQYIIDNYPNVTKYLIQQR